MRLTTRAAVKRYIMVGQNIHVAKANGLSRRGSYGGGG